jgi:four helix bundle protein
MNVERADQLLSGFEGLAGRNVSCRILLSADQRVSTEEMFGMTSQIRRAASSIPANIAEGHGREGTRTFIQYLRIAQGSLKEVETHLLLAARVKLISQQRIEAVLDGYQHLGRMLRALIRRLEKKVD